jgi:hypothetical protein
MGNLCYGLMMSGNVDVVAQPTLVAIMPQIFHVANNLQNICWLM